MSRIANSAAARSEYDPVSLRPSWIAVSFACLALALLADDWLQWLPWRPRQLWHWRLLNVLAPGALGLMGWLAGWMERRRRPASRMARWGMVLNAIVVVLTGLLLLALLWIFGRR